VVVLSGVLDLSRFLMDQGLELGLGLVQVRSLTLPIPSQVLGLTESQELQLVLVPGPQLIHPPRRPRTSPEHMSSRTIYLVENKQIRACVPRICTVASVINYS
jgi:hypothetical protein